MLGRTTLASQYLPCLPHHKKIMLLPKPLANESILMPAASPPSMKVQKLQVNCNPDSQRYVTVVLITLRDCKFLLSPVSTSTSTSRLICCDTQYQ